MLRGIDTLIIKTVQNTKCHSAIQLTGHNKASSNKKKSKQHHVAYHHRGTNDWYKKKLTITNLESTSHFLRSFKYANKRDVVIKRCRWSINVTSLKGSKNRSLKLRHSKVLFHRMHKKQNNHKLVPDDVRLRDTGIQISTATVVDHSSWLLKEVKNRLNINTLLFLYFLVILDAC